MVWISSINRMIWPSCLDSSFRTAFRRSSNSPRNLAPAISEPISRDSTFLSFRPSGTSPLTMRWARPSTMAVLPTPGSPISTGLFFRRRCNTWMVRRISSSRPITGSSLPASARSVRSIVYLDRAWRFSSAPASLTASPPRTSSIAFSSAALSTPCSLSTRPRVPRSSSAASNISSLEMNWSLRFWASLSAILNRRPISLDMETSPADPCTSGRFSISRAMAWRMRPGSAPACLSSGLMALPS